MDHYEAALKKVRQSEERTQLLVEHHIDASTTEFAYLLLHVFNRGSNPGSRLLIGGYATTYGEGIVDFITSAETKLIQKLLEYWNSAKTATEKEEGINPTTLLTASAIGAVGLISLTRKWKTAITQDAFLKGWKVLTQGWKHQVTADDLARDLRQFVQEPVKYNAARIAFSEIHDIRAKAETRLFQKDPYVTAIQWTLSPNRGNWNPPDECDILAGTDFYGLGKGVYPVNKIPATPHPWDRCERIPVKRSPNETNQPKPDPDLLLDPLNPDDVSIPGGRRITEVAAKHARESAWYAISNPL